MHGPGVILTLTRGMVKRRVLMSEGAAAWQLVLSAWDAFRSWVGKVLGLCSLLSDCISAEQVLSPEFCSSS